MTRGERGSGLLSTVIGVAVVVAVLGLAVNLAVGLWLRSTVDAIAYDAARSVAAEPDVGARPAAAQRALATARGMLGDRHRTVDLEFESLEPTVRLRVRSEGLDLLPAMIDGGPTVAAMDRTVVVRAERP